MHAAGTGGRGRDSAAPSAGERPRNNGGTARGYEIDTRAGNRTNSNQDQQGRGSSRSATSNTPEEAPRTHIRTEGHARRRLNENDRKTTIKIASLNMNGFGNLTQDHPENKWSKAYRMLSEHRIGVLLLQETHLTEERKAAIHRMFAKKIKVLYSAHPTAPTQREGVAVVLNCRYVNTTEISVEEIVPGRALQVKIPCQGGEAKHILCVYAPTSSGVDERRRFFEEVRLYYESHPTLHKPDLMAGDFNNVEDALDRLPVNGGPDKSMNALDELKISLGLMLADGWRVTYPNLREYTFHRGTGRDAVFSRLDRIYVSTATFDGAREWAICEAGIKTDHSLISVQLTTANAPVVGPGRPVFSLHLIRDKKLNRAIKLRGLEAIRELAVLESSGLRSEEANPQLLLHRFKGEAMKLARTREREVVTIDEERKNRPLWSRYANRRWNAKRSPWEIICFSDYFS